MDAGTWRGIFAVVMLILFIGIWAWAWSARRKSVFDAAARMPLDESDESPAPGTRDKAGAPRGEAGERPSV